MQGLGNLMIFIYSFLIKENTKKFNIFRWWCRIPARKSMASGLKPGESKYQSNMLIGT